MRGCLGIVLAAFLACAGLGPAAAAEAGIPARSVDPAEVELLALNMYHEAKGEGRRGMLAVGWVVLNRAADEGFPESIEGVIRQGCQFGWTCDERSDEPDHRAYWALALSLARQLLTDPPADPTRGAMWFHHAEREAPGWGGRIAPSARIGDHLFYARANRLPTPRRKPGRLLQVAQR